MSSLAGQHVDQIIGLELVADVAQGFERHLQRGFRVYRRFGMPAIIAVPAVLLGILLAEVMEQGLAAAHGTFGVGDGLDEQQLADFLLGDGLALHELFELLDVLITIKGKAMPSPPSRPARPVSW